MFIHKKSFELLLIEIQGQVGRKDYMVVEPISKRRRGFAAWNLKYRGGLSERYRISRASPKARNRSSILRASQRML